MSLDEQLDHYRVLGLDPSASSGEVREAVERLAEQADLLAYTSQQRSQQLWARIRQIRHDLLTTDERRQAYDRALQDAPSRTPPAPAAGQDAAAGPQAARDPSLSFAPGPALRQATKPVVGSAPVAAERKAPRRARWRRSPWPALTAVSLLVIALLAVLAARGLQPSPPRVIDLTVTGRRHGGAYASGQTLTLRWGKVPGAGVYRAQIDVSSSPPPAASLFGRTVRWIVTPATTVRLPIVGAQLYFWRVQAYRDGRWGPFSPPQEVRVERPSIQAPAVTAPGKAVLRGASQVRLCWSPVAGASGYRLEMTGQPVRAMRSPCLTVQVKPGTYTWRVAALVRAARLYTGPSSVRASFTVLPPSTRKPARKVQGRARPKPGHTR